MLCPADQSCNQRDSCGCVCHSPPSVRAQGGGDGSLAASGNLGCDKHTPLRTSCSQTPLNAIKQGHSYPQGLTCAKPQAPSSYPLCFIKRRPDLISLLRTRHCTRYTAWGREGRAAGSLAGPRPPYQQQGFELENPVMEEGTGSLDGGKQLGCSRT